MKIISLLGEASKKNKATPPINRGLLYTARQNYPEFSDQPIVALDYYLADELEKKTKVDSNQNRLIDTQKRENDRLRGAVQSLGQELQDFEQQSQETDREVERLKQLSGKISQGDATTQRKAKIEADDLQKLEKEIQNLKSKPGIDAEKVKKLEDQVKQIAKNPSFDNSQLDRVQGIVNSFNSKQVVSDDLYQRAFSELTKLQANLDAKEVRFRNYISKKGGEARTSSQEIKKYSDIVKGYKTDIDKFGNQMKDVTDQLASIKKEKDITYQLRAGVQQNAQEISDMKDQIQGQLDLITNMTNKLTNQASNDSVMQEPAGAGPRADVLNRMAVPKGKQAEKNITKGAEQMIGRKLAEGIDSKPIRPLQKYKNPKYNEWITKHLPALVQIFKNRYWEELENPKTAYTDKQIHHIIEKYTPLLYNSGDENTPLTAEQVDNWIAVVKNKLWEQSTQQQFDLFAEGLDKTYARMLDDIIGLDYIKKG